jgi:hypothetical protein
MGKATSIIKYFFLTQRMPLTSAANIQYSKKSFNHRMNEILLLTELPIRWR